MMLYSSASWAHRAHVSEQLHARERSVDSVTSVVSPKSFLASLKTTEIIYYIVSYIYWCVFNLSHPPVSAPMHVGERPTWLNTGDFSFEKYFMKFSRFYQEIFIQEIFDLLKTFFLKK